MTELPDDVHQLIEGVNYADLATLLPDGAPHIVPVWTGLEGGRLAVLTGGTDRRTTRSRLPRDRGGRSAGDVGDAEQSVEGAAVPARRRVHQRLDLLAPQDVRPAGQGDRGMGTDHQLPPRFAPHSSDAG